MQGHCDLERQLMLPRSQKGVKTVLPTKGAIELVFFANRLHDDCIVVLLFLNHKSP